MNKIQSIGQWSDISAALNQNFEVIAAKLSQLDVAAWKALGVYPNKSALEQAAPSAPAGTYAYVGSGDSYNLYIYDGGWTTEGDALTASQVLIPAFDWKNSMPAASDDSDGYMTSAHAQLLFSHGSSIMGLSNRVTVVETTANTAKQGLASANKSISENNSAVTRHETSINEINSTLAGLTSLSTRCKNVADYVTNAFGGEEVYASANDAYAAALGMAKHKDRVLMLFTAAGDRGAIMQIYTDKGVRQYLALGAKRYTRLVTGNTATDWEEIISEVSAVTYDETSGEVRLSAPNGFTLSANLPIPRIQEQLSKVVGYADTNRGIALASAPKLSAILDSADGEIVNEEASGKFEVVFVKDKGYFLARQDDTFYTSWGVYDVFSTCEYYGTPDVLGVAPAQGRLYNIDDDLYIWTAGTLRRIAETRIEEIAEYIARDKANVDNAIIELQTITADMSKKVINSVDVNELDGLTTPVLSALGKADYWLTKTYGNQPLIIGRVFLFEDPFMHKITQIVVSNQILDENYPNGGHTSESLTVCYRFYGQTNSDVPMKQWTPWKKMYDSGDTKLERAGEFLSKLEIAFGTTDLNVIVDKLAEVANPANGEAYIALKQE